MESDTVVVDGPVFPVGRTPSGYENVVAAPGPMLKWQVHEAPGAPCGGPASQVPGNVPSIPGFWTSEPSVIVRSAFTGWPPGPIAGPAYATVIV